VEGDLRAALQYIPSFQGKVFVLVLNAARMPEQALAEVILDMIALQQVGVKLALISTGSGEAEVANHLIDGELKWELVGREDSPERIGKVLDRGQLALIEAPAADFLSDEVIHLASGLSPTKLVIFLPEGGVGEALGMHAISRESASSWRGQASVLLSKAASACSQGIPRVHLLDERRQGVLLDELFSNEGVGVMIHADNYLEIRDLTIEDIPELLAMIGRSMRDAHLIPRTYEQVEQALQDFLVLTVDGNVVGCVALHQYPELNCAELACLYVKQSHEGGGYGLALVKAAEQRAHEKESSWIFALTTRAYDYFTQQLGYEKGSLEDLPAERKKRLIESGRESLVVRKDVSS